MALVLNHDLLFSVGAIFTGLQVVDTSPNQWLPKVMGGFVGWEVLFFLLFDFYAQWSKNIGPEGNIKNQKHGNLM